MKNLFRIVVSLFIFTLSGCFSNSDKAEQESSPPSRPNIIFAFADDWGFPHAGIYGDKVVNTPNFDSLALNGLLFNNAFCASPSCSASRASVLTGRYPNQIEAGANLWSYLPNKYKVYPEILAEAGYHTGYSDKGWGPGAGWIEGWATHEEGYQDNPAGKKYDSFENFLEDKSNADQPFSFWFGSTDPHRPYDAGEGIRAGKKIDDVELPSYLYNSLENKSDMLDYYNRVERFDRDIGNIITVLKERGLLENTFIVITSDNGHPFDRAKANLYDAGTRVPMVIYWKDKVVQGERDELINLLDLMATFVDLAGLPEPENVSSKSLLPLLLENKKDDRYDRVFLSREKHYFPNQEREVSEESYPMRAVRTKDFLYIRNIKPERWPGITPLANSEMEAQLLNYESYPKDSQVYIKGLAFGKRQAEELFDIANDPHNLNNLADDHNYLKLKNELKGKLYEWMVEVKDPMVDETEIIFDLYPSFRMK